MDGYAADGLQRYDHLPPASAVIAAWSLTGPSPSTHEAGRAEVRRSMPALARALDRLVAEVQPLPIRPVIPPAVPRD